MSADQVAEMAPLVREVFAAGADDAAEWCATFEVVGNASAWAQVTASSLNLAYPFADAPLLRLADVVRPLPEVELVGWEAGKYATFSFGSASASVVARAVDDALTLLFALGDYSVDGQLEQL